MELIEVENAAAYLRSTGRVTAGEPLEVTYLAGGVSNVVLYVRRPQTVGGDFVLKQARQQLRVPQPWFCSVERIWREIEVLNCCAELLDRDVLSRERASRDAPSPPGAGAAATVQVPRILFEDRENFLFAMSAAPLGHGIWKQQLLSGEYRADIAAACGTLLGQLHGGTWHRADVADRFEGRQFFDDLRLDPYYRQVARVYPELKSPLDELVASVWSERHCLVHGDFSPKNLLVWPDGLMLIDFEVGHYGDPAFDLGFLLTHLVLKTLHAGPRGPDCLALTDSFWHGYWAALAPATQEVERRALLRRAIANLAGCVLARVDGKSQVDYLADKSLARRLGREWLLDPPHDWSEVTRSIAATF